MAHEEQQNFSIDWENMKQLDAIPPSSFLRGGRMYVVPNEQTGWRERERESSP